MPSGMTGFASGERQVGKVRIHWRVKSVNHRFLDLALRLPEGCEELELLAARHLKERFVRGHLDCLLTFQGDAGTERAFELDPVLLRALLAVEQQIRIHPAGGGREPLSMDRLLSWPGLMRERRLVDDLLSESGRAEVLALLDAVCTELDRIRGAEGRALVEVMRRLLEDLAARVAEVLLLVPQMRESLEARLKERVAAYLGQQPEMDDGLGRELAYLFNRVDVAEEVDRLGVHVGEMGALLAAAGPVGLRLDFLCQELNREANTLCSKSQDRHLSRLGVEIKVIVEQLREQARNLE
ncbi:MAG: YicC family protein [Magnetococcales bacterium]|nr:YicC family protein [Magnetococcales bacterium]